MTEDPHKKRVAELVHTLLDVDAVDRERYFLEHHPDDPELKQEVLRLLELEPTATGFLDNTHETTQRIGKYRILATLGEGGMGVVYLAEQTEPIRRRVALKLIKLGMDTREVIARFEVERQALAMMDHPNIARVYEAGATADGRPYFAMEHVEGELITDFCDRHKLSLTKRLKLFLQVCRGIEHAHHRGIIHRDIKPSNILVTMWDREPLAKLIDFGVARATNQRLSEKTIYTELGRAIGTPAYMSPEQAEMTGSGIDHRTDIYALGVLLYELLVGQQPLEFDFGVVAFDEIVRRIREQDPPSPSTRLSRLNPETTRQLAANRQTNQGGLAHELRGDLDWISMKAMDKDRARRYETASELAADVTNYMSDEPVLAGPPSATYRLRKFVRKNRGVVMSASAVILVLLASIATFWGISVYRSRVRFGAHMRTGEESWTRYLTLRRTLDQLERRWREERDKLETWQPVWEREDEFEAWDRYQEAEKGIDERYNQAVISYHQAMQETSEGGFDHRGVREKLEEIYWSRYREAEETGAVGLGADFFKSMIESLKVGTHYRQLSGGGRVILKSEPSGAEVFCFRYEEIEKRQLPLPFDPTAGGNDPSAGFVGKPFLEVERIWREPSPFRASDRFLTVDKRAVHTRTDLARVLRAVIADQKVEVGLRRDGDEETVDWVPFPSETYRDRGDESPSRPGRLINPHEQFGLTFAGYPLDFTDACHVGSTRPDSLLAIDLPRGSYLIVLRQEGHRDARLPVSVPRKETWRESVFLPKEDGVPPGFVYIPASPFFCGGDEEAFEGLDPAEVSMKGFFMSRLEVTVAEYLEFLNDPEVLANTEDRYRPPVTREAKEEIGRLGLSAGRLVPRGPYWTRDDETGRWETRRPPDFPLYDVPQIAAIEYAHWRSSRDGGRWRYRLPTDHEWEKAARGADGRVFVWGDYPAWSFCRSLKGIHTRKKVLMAGGRYPLDESVYGVRDLTGSLQEYTANKKGWRNRYASVRGGFWNTPDDYYFRLCTRNGRAVEGSGPGNGIRLVAELEDAE